MSNITMPLWLLLLGIGLPAISFTALVMGLIRAKRARLRFEKLHKETHQMLPFKADNQFNSDIYKMVLDQQIDAVFLSLSTIIETEKVKLKALLSGQRFMEQPFLSEPSQPPLSMSSEMNGTDQGDASAAEDLADVIGTKASKGMSPKEIARDMGLSLSEVVLALRMHSGSFDTRVVGRQLEAVA